MDYGDGGRPGLRQCMGTGLAYGL